MNRHEREARPPEPPSTPLEVPRLPDLVRRFDPDRPIPDSLLLRILRKAAESPAGYGLQPWRFLVIRSARNRHRLAGCCHGQRIVAEAPVVVVILGDQAPQRSHLDPMIDGLVRAGYLSASEGAFRRAFLRSALDRLPDPALWALRSASPTAGCLLRAAREFGVDPAWIEGFHEEPLRQAFGIPDDHAVCAIIALGYALETEPSMPPLSLEQLCNEEHFGQPWSLGEP